VFRRDHTSETVAERVDHLMAAVFIADPDERMERLGRYLSADFVYVSPDAVFDGADGLSEAFSRFRHGDWPGTVLRRTSPVDLHHGYFRYTWERVERGVRAMEGWSFGSVDEAGAIDRVVVFEGLAPGQS
jgi:hypothetical protein